MAWKSVQFCDSCWGFFHTNKKPIKIEIPDEEAENCFECGELTTSGIFVRRQVKS